MDAAKKKNPLVVLAFGKKRGEDEGDDEGMEDTEEGGEGDQEGCSAAADEVFDALKEGDRDAFASALKSFVKLC